MFVRHPHCVYKFFNLIESHIKIFMRQNISKFGEFGYSGG